MPWDRRRAGKFHHPNDQAVMLRRPDCARKPKSPARSGLGADHASCERRSDFSRPCGARSAKAPTSPTGRTAGASRRRGAHARPWRRGLFGGPPARARRDAGRDDSRRPDPAHWRRVALIVARMTGKRVGLDTATRMANDADLSPDGKPDELRGARPFRTAFVVGRVESHSFAEVTAGTRTDRTSYFC